jgi:hypothetical protein
MVFRYRILIMFVCAAIAMVGCSQPSEARPQKEAAVRAPSVPEVGTSPPEQKAAPTPADNYRIEVREESYETFVDVFPKDSNLPKWDFRPKSKGLFLVWDRDRPLALQVKPLLEMLKLLSDRYKDLLMQSTLSASLDCVNYPAYVERLARFAALDPAWRNQNGMDLHNYIVEATRSESLAPELSQIFNTLKVTLYLKGVEKCSAVSPAFMRKLGCSWSLPNLPRNKKLPMGCLMAWFEMRKQ